MGRSDSGDQSMRANLFWLDDEQWAKIEPLIPMNRPLARNRGIIEGF
jgi:hypothetical protein